MRNLRLFCLSSALLKVQILCGAPWIFYFFYTYIAHRSTNTCIYTISSYEKHKSWIIWLCTGDYTSIYWNLINVPDYTQTIVYTDIYFLCEISKIRVYVRISLSSKITWTLYVLQIVKSTLLPISFFTCLFFVLTTFTSRHKIFVNGFRLE